MKFIFSQMAYFMAQQSNKRNIRFMLRFSFLVLLLVILYSVLFHFIMVYEGRDYSSITGLYWTLTVMSTLGFGDITFNSDLGKVFSIVVLMSGVLLFMLVMPFTFIRFFYAPWLDAQASAVVPEELPEHTSGHVIVAGTDSIALSIAARLRQSGIANWLLVADSPKALELFDRGYAVVSGELDSPRTYEKLRADKAALVVALDDDLKNTNIAATVREVAPTAPMAAGVDHVDSMDILRLAGCTEVFHFTRMLGEALARRVFGPSRQVNVIGRFEDLCVAEAPALHTPYVGKTLLETDLRRRYGLNVAGIWQGKEYRPAMADTRIDAASVMLLAGTAERLEQYDADMRFESDSEERPVLILGGGRVGMAVAESLEARGIPFTLVEKNPKGVPDDPRFVLGSAADIDILRKAGIDHTHTAIVTTHNDDLNIYLTIYCRKLRPDLQIISRATLDRNVASLYSAGANLVMSHASMAANTITNVLTPDRVFMLTEGLNVFKVLVPKALVGINLRDSNIRRDTQCNVVAIRGKEKRFMAPDPAAPLEPGDELVLIGSVDAEKSFIERYTV